MLRIFILFFAFLLTLPGISAAEKGGGSSVKELFSLANLAFLDGRYEEAIESYQAILDRGIVNPDVYYNLGNTYVKLGEEGKAILFYEKNLKLAATDEDALYNLGIVKARLNLSENILGIDSPWEKLLGFLTFKSCADLSFFLYLVLFILLIVREIFPSENIKKKLKMSPIIVLILFISSGTITLLKLINQKSDDFGIVIAEEAEIYEAPFERGTPNGSVSEGMKVRLDNMEKQWIEVSTIDGSKGWIKQEKVGVI